MSETPLAQLRDTIAQMRQAMKSPDEPPDKTWNWRLDDWADTLSALLTDLEAAPPHQKNEEVVTRVATGETMPATGSTAKTANGLSGTLPDADVQLIAWAVVNCHQLARRALARSTSVYDREKWEHVLRICEKAGARSQGVLRASLPTELTEGEAAASRPAEPKEEWVGPAEYHKHTPGCRARLGRMVADDACTCDWRKRAAVSPAVEGGREDDLQERAEALWEELGGQLCICQHPEVPHWCESCQLRIQLIREAFQRAALHGRAAPRAKNQEE